MLRGGVWRNGLGASGPMVSAVARAYNEGVGAEPLVGGQGAKSA